LLTNNVKFLRQSSENIGFFRFASIFSNIDCRSAKPDALPHPFLLHKGRQVGSLAAAILAASPDAGTENILKRSAARRNLIADLQKSHPIASLGPNV
jgi:hypothetical protein